MPTLARKAGRHPVRNLRIIGTPGPAAKTVQKAKPAAQAKPVSRSKVFAHLADALAQVAGVVKSLREREGRIVSGTANRLAAQLSSC